MPDADWLAVSCSTPMALSATNASMSSLSEARHRISAWKEDYNTHRPHSSLGNLTPTEFATQRALEKQIA